MDCKYLSFWVTWRYCKHIMLSDVTKLNFCTQHNHSVSICLWLETLWSEQMWNTIEMKTVGKPIEACYSGNTSIKNSASAILVFKIYIFFHIRIKREKILHFFKKCQQYYCLIHWISAFLFFFCLFIWMPEAQDYKMTWIWKTKNKK